MSFIFKLNQRSYIVKNWNLVSFYDVSLASKFVLYRCKSIIQFRGYTEYRGFPIQMSQAQNHLVASSSTQPFTLPSLIKCRWVPGTPGNFVVKSKLPPRSGSLALRTPSIKRGHIFFSFAWNAVVMLWLVLLFSPWIC